MTADFLIANSPKNKYEVEIKYNIQRYVGNDAGLRVEASSNVFVEDLQSTRSLETTYYVTDATQAYDSFWDRESGLRVHIGILNVHLIPEYEDVDHDGDNNYMLTDPSSSEDKSVYRAVTHNFCR